MKCISLSPPYGTLIALLLKGVETRGWSTQHRGPLAIHQTAAPGPKGTTEAALWELCSRAPFGAALQARGYGSVAQLPRGKIVAVVDLVECRATGGGRVGGPKYADWVHGLSATERAFGDYTPGRYGWLLSDVVALAEPIPARGMPGLWDVPHAVEAQIDAQLARPRCPRCGVQHDVSYRTNGDKVWCTKADLWFQVWFRPEGTQLLACDAPPGWPKLTPEDA